MSEEKQEQVNEEVPVTAEVVEVEWEEVKELVEVRQALIATDSQLSNMMISYEKQKAKLLSHSQRLEAALYELGHNLRDEKGIDSSATYELKLPDTAGEKAYFLKKAD
tara:strand:+ start:521 stop:844 length:324 start_codon:yes stop_codon:yes gene_type:complete